MRPAQAGGVRRRPWLEKPRPASPCACSRRRTLPPPGGKAPPRTSTSEARRNRPCAASAARIAPSSRAKRGRRRPPRTTPTAQYASRSSRKSVRENGSSRGGLVVNMGLVAIGFLHGPSPSASPIGGWSRSCGHGNGSFTESIPEPATAPLEARNRVFSSNRPATASLLEVSSAAGWAGKL